MTEEVAAVVVAAAAAAVSAGVGAAVETVVHWTDGPTIHFNKHKDISGPLIT